MSSTAIADEGYDDLEDDGGLSGFWILVIFLVVLSVFAAIVYFAYQRGLDDRGVGNELPTISANPSPVREEVATGPTYDARADEVYDELNGSADTTRIVADVDPGRDPLTDYDEGLPSTGGSAADDVDAQLTQAIEAEQSAATTYPVPVPNLAPERTTPGSGSSSSTPATSTPSAPAPSTTTTATGAPGTYTVQLGAYGSNDEAMGVYNRLTNSVGGLISNYTPEINVATVKGTTYHRLWIGEFDTRDAAAAHCERVTAAGQGCFIQRR